MEFNTKQQKKYDEYEQHLTSFEYAFPALICGSVVWKDVHILPEHLGSSLVFGQVPVAQYLDLCFVYYCFSVGLFLFNHGFASSVLSYEFKIPATIVYLSLCSYVNHETEVIDMFNKIN